MATIRTVTARAVHAGIPPDEAALAFAEARSAPGKSWIDLTHWRTP